MYLFIFILFFELYFIIKGYNSKFYIDQNKITLDFLYSPTFNNLNARISIYFKKKSK